MKGNYRIWTCSAVFGFVWTVCSVIIIESSSVMSWSINLKVFVLATITTLRAIRMIWSDILFLFSFFFFIWFSQDKHHSTRLLCRIGSSRVIVDAILHHTLPTWHFLEPSNVVRDHNTSVYIIIALLFMMFSKLILRFTYAHASYDCDWLEIHYAFLDWLNWFTLNTHSSAMNFLAKRIIIKYAHY